MNNKLCLLINYSFIVTQTCMFVSASEGNSQQIQLAVSEGEFLTSLSQILESNTSVAPLVAQLLLSLKPTPPSRPILVPPPPPSEHPLLSNRVIQNKLNQITDPEQKAALEQLLIRINANSQRQTALNTTKETLTATRNKLKERNESSRQSRTTQPVTTGYTKKRKGPAAAYKRLTVLTKEDGA